MKKLFLLFGLLLTACGSSEAEIQTAIAEMEPTELARMLLSYDDLVDVEADLATLWKSNKVDLDCMINYLPAHRCKAIGFVPSSATYQPIIYQLVKFEDEKTAEVENNKAKKTIGITGKELEFNSTMILPDNIWYMVVESNLFVGFSLDRYNFVVLMTKLPGGESETLREYLSLVVQKQVELIENGIE